MLWWPYKFRLTCHHVDTHNSDWVFLGSNTKKSWMCQICFAVHPSVEERLLLRVCCESHGVNKQVNKAYLNKTNPSHRVLWRSIDKISPHQKEKWTCISLNCSFIDLNKLAKAGVLKNSWHETAVHTITTDHHGSRFGGLSQSSQSQNVFSPPPPHPQLFKSLFLIQL